MPRFLIHIRAVEGMNRAEPSTLLDPDAERGILVPRELLNVDPYRLPSVVPRPGFTPVHEPTSGARAFPLLL